MSDLLSGADLPWDFVVASGPIRQPLPLPPRVSIPRPTVPAVFDETTDLVAVAQRIRQDVEDDVLAAACDGDAGPTMRSRMTVAAARVIARRRGDA